MVRLTIIKPEKTPEYLVFDKPAEVVVGRSTRSAITLDFDPMVSRMHAVFMIDPPKVRIKDLNSTNGLRINGEFYGADSAYKADNPLDLADGDEVIIGSTRFCVELGAENGKNAASPQPARVGDPPSAADRHPAAARRSPGANGPNAEETVSGMGTALPHVPGYRIIRYLSSGAAGKVYLGVPNGEERSVAIKILFPPSGLAPETLKFFFRDFDVARNITHPHLARLLGAGELSRGGGLFLVSEYVGGDDLGQYAARHGGGRLLSGQALGILVQIAGAVCKLHRQGMVHLDLKPQSVMIRDDGRVVAKVTDVGFSDFLEMTDLQPRIYPGRRQEKLGFLAPEQLAPGARPGPSADVFALCALLFFMLSGIPPYRFGDGDDRNAVERGDLLEIDRMARGAPEALLDIARRGLNSKPEERYADACELLAALESLLS